MVVGYNFMKEYYTMFDASTIDPYGYIQVGIAPRNKKVDIGQIRYDTTFKDYQRADKSLDTSMIMAGYEDQYDMEIKVDPGNKPNYPNDPDNVPDDDEDEKTGIHGW
jgi:hypothetical protein